MKVFAAVVVAVVVVACVVASTSALPITARLAPKTFRLAPKTYRFAPSKTLRFNADYLQSSSNASVADEPNCSWTLYKQCDSAWGSNHLGTSSDTICSAGCAMSSVAMLLHSRGLNYNPGSLNSWLISNGGYASGDLIIWSAVDRLGKTSYQGMENPSESVVASGLSQCHGIIANVRGGSHWVLLTGYQGNGVFSVNDPGFSQSTYNYGDMLRFAVYH
eukprot:m.32617 g.32617  ORF g.32617 m.32617 type:complete len:218 (-) comp6393_c0_seq2:5479-6132(-)